MINDISASNSIYSTQAVSQVYSAASAPPENTDIKETESEAVTVDLSENAKAANKVISELVPLSLDPAIHLQKAENRLKELMTKLGIPETTEVDIQIDATGSFKVAGDHPLLSKIEEQLNDGSERELSNHLKSAHNGSIIQRIGAAVEMAMQGADANPAMTDTYYGWVKNTVAAQAKSMGYSATFNNGTLSGSLINAEGKRIALNEGLTLPAG
ncbi:MAG: hypothetical protein JKX94_03860 [Sneathiella sp.]|nr:hypothetical protein [Sneathiella sp.]